MNFKRRMGQFLFAALIVSASGAIAATLFSDALSDLTKYFKAASSLVLRASIGLDDASLTLFRRRSAIPRRSSFELYSNNYTACSLSRPHS